MQPQWMIGALALGIGTVLGMAAWHTIARVPEQMYDEWHRDALDILARYTRTQPDPTQQVHASEVMTPKAPHPAGKLAVLLLCALLSVWAYAVHGWTLWYALSLAFMWFGVVLGGIDLRVQLLPDRLVLPLGMIGLFANGFGLITNASDASFGAVIGFVALWGINALYRLLRGHDGMGLGDAKLLAACGAWLGVHQLPVVVLIAATLGVLVGIIHQMRLGSSQPFAFGPYLIIAAWLSLLYGDQITQLYLGLFEQ